ncbi:MAG: hypothetical protein LBI45_07235 [Bacteroidales bacterium]|jgi:hypothetical protein|nr:hypothetical protein [Bacteroidales bacterium]
MANQNLLDKTEGLVSNPKRLLALLIILAVIAVVFYFSWSKIKALFNSISTKIALDSDISKEIDNGNPPSYNDAKYKEFANRLYTAMKGAGTDKTTIKDVFEQMINITDVLKLVQAFGVRDGENLQQWLDGEVHWWKPGDIKKEINKTLTKKGIFYKF